MSTAVEAAIGFESPPTSTWRQVPVSRSHTRAVQSFDSVTARRPSWLTSAAFTPPLCTRLASRSPRFCSAHLSCAGTQQCQTAQLAEGSGGRSCNLCSLGTFLDNAHEG